MAKDNLGRGYQEVGSSKLEILLLPETTEATQTPSFITGRKYFEVRLFSAMKPGVISSLTVDPEDCVSEEGICKHLTIKAGALAENQNEKYGDQHDPHAVAGLVGEAFRECCLDAAGRGNTNVTMH